MHTKFDHIFEFQESSTIFTIYAAFHRESNAVYSFHKSYAVMEIQALILIGVFCVHKPGFLMPGHICTQLHT